MKLKRAAYEAFFNVILSPLERLFSARSHKLYYNHVNIYIIVCNSQHNISNIYNGNKIIYIKHQSNMVDLNKNLFIYLFIYYTLPRTTTTTRTSTNRQLDETSTTRQLDNKHEQKWQGHHNSENQLLWALITQKCTIC